MRIIAALLLAGLITTSIPAAQEDDPASMRLVLERCGTLLLREGHARQEAYAEALKYSAVLSKNGSWPDIDYEGRDPAGWAPSRHLARTRTRALALAGDGGTGQQAAGLRRAAVAVVRIDPPGGK